MNLWKRYRQAIEVNLSGDSISPVGGVEYWRDRLFLLIVVYALPVCMIAYIPAMIICYYLREPYIAFYDNLVVLMLVVLTFSKGLSIKWRKRLFVSMLYVLSVSLLYYMGAYGPGLLYLLSTVVVVSLVYSSTMAFWCIGFNTAICLLFALGMQWNVMSSAMVTIYTPEAWLAVASNLLLLSILFVAAIQVVISGFGVTLEKENTLKETIKQEAMESEKLVKELKIKNEEMEQFTYIASHDLQEPLNTILGIVEVLKLPGAKNEDKDYAKSLGYIAFSVERLRSLIKGLLDYSTIGRKLQLEQVDCRELIVNVAKDLHSAISASGANIIIDDSVAHLQPLSLSRLEFNQLFQNLISNALKFRKENQPPVIEISAKEEEDFYRFVIKDNGIGISKESQEKIFIIFSRGHSNESYTGTGIGLAFCKKIVELHEGEIWVESEVGKGSAFAFTVSKSIANT